MLEKKLEFETKEEAMNYMLKGDFEQYSGKKSHYFYPAGRYYLRHGEYDRPDYIVRKIRNGGYGIYVKTYFYGGTLYNPGNYWLTNRHYG